MQGDSPSSLRGLGFRAFFPSGAEGEESQLVSDAVAAHIVSLIDGGSLRRGDRLPTERDLVTRLGVSRSAVREGLRILETMGLVEAHVGRGRFLVRDPATLQSAVFVREWLELHEGEMSELTEIREVLEGAAIRSIPMDEVADLAADLRVIMTKAEAAFEEGDLAAVVKIDHEFHRIPLDRSGNRSLGTLTKGVLHATRQTALAVLSVKEAAKMSLDEHRGILEAFENHDLELAAELTGLHERTSYRRVLEG